MHIRLFLFLCLALGRAYSQIPDLPIKTYEYDTTYIQDYGDLIAVRVVSPRRIYDFRVKNRESKDVLVYRPNLQSALGLGFTYRWLAFDVVFNPKWNGKKNERFGETKELNVKGTLYLKKYMLDVMFRRYKGLHISNPDDYLNPWDGLYPYRPDIKSTNFIVTFSMPSNYEKYSPKTTFQLDGRMKKSAGSIMYLSTLHFSFLRADSSIMPIEYQNKFSLQARITDKNIVLLKQSIGYAYTYIYKRLYFTLSAFPGVALAFGKVVSERETYNPVSLNFSLHSKNGLGYNSRRWYAGLYFIYNYQNIKLTDDLASNTNLGEWRLFIGYRFKAPYIIHSMIKK